MSSCDPELRDFGTNSFGVNRESEYSTEAPVRGAVSVLESRFGQDRNFRDRF